MKASDKQIGGTHYKGYAILPYEFFFRNRIPHHKAAIIRRILRYDHPTGRGLEDLEKIKHEVDLIIEMEGWHGPKSGEVQTVQPTGSVREGYGDTTGTRRWAGSSGSNVSRAESGLGRESFTPTVCRECGKSIEFAADGVRLESGGYVHIECS